MHNALVTRGVFVSKHLQVEMVRAKLNSVVIKAPSQKVGKP